MKEVDVEKLGTIKADIDQLDPGQEKTDKQDDSETLEYRIEGNTHKLDRLKRELELEEDFKDKTDKWIQNMRH